MKNSSMAGANNHEWKGDNVGYEGLHQYLRTNFQIPSFCQECDKNAKLDLANISGKYLREISDYRWLCRSCHMNSDGRKDNLLKGQAPNVERDPKTGKFRRVR